MASAAAAAIPSNVWPRRPTPRRVGTAQGRPRSGTARRRVPRLLGIAVEDDPPVAQSDDAREVAGGQIQVVQAHDQRQAASSELDEELDEARAPGSTDRLVGEQEPRFLVKGARHRDALLLTPREAVDALVEMVAHPDPIEERVDSLAGRGGRPEDVAQSPEESEPAEAPGDVLDRPRPGTRARSW